MTTKAAQRAQAYGLVESLLGGARVEVDTDLGSTLSAGLSTLVRALSIEESFQVFAHSYLRFEKDLVDISFEYTYVTPRFNEELNTSIRQRLNVSIITMLSSFKSYDDLSNAGEFEIQGLDARPLISGIRKSAFDASLSYRICAKLRDYAQHRALPLGGFEIGGRANLDRDSSGHYKKLDTGYNVHPWLDVKKLKDSSQCKSALRQELTNLGYARIDMKWLIRSFASAIYERHSHVRELLKPEVVAAGGKIAEGYQFFHAKTGINGEFLMLEEVDQNRAMRIDLAEIVLKLFGRYPSLAAAERKYVTSQIELKPEIYSGPSRTMPRS